LEGTVIGEGVGLGSVGPRLRTRDLDKGLSEEIHYLEKEKVGNYEVFKYFLFSAENVTLSLKMLIVHNVLPRPMILPLACTMGKWCFERLECSAVG